MITRLARTAYNIITLKTIISDPELVKLFPEGYFPPLVGDANDPYPLITTKNDLLNPLGGFMKYRYIVADANGRLRHDALYDFMHLPPTGYLLTYRAGPVGTPDDLQLLYGINIADIYVASSVVQGAAPGEMTEQYFVESINPEIIGPIAESLGEDATYIFKKLFK